MTGISATVTTGPYAGTGSTTVYPFDFPVSSGAELEVQINGVAISPALYTVAITSDGTGTVTFSTAPAIGAVILLVSVPDFQQESQFGNEGAYNLSTVNAINRRQTIKSQWLARVVQASVRGPLGETLAPLPDALARANQALLFDSAGNPTVGDVGPAGDAVVAQLRAQFGNWIIISPTVNCDATLDAAIGAAAIAGVGVTLARGTWVFNSAHDFGRVPFQGQGENATVIHTALNGVLFKITVNATLEGNVYSGMTFISDIATGGAYSNSAAIEVGGDATGFIQYGGIRDIATYSFHTGIKVTKATRTTGFGAESDLDWYSLSRLTFNGGLNPGVYGVRFMSGSGTGTTIYDIKGNLGVGNAASAYFRYEGACVVGDIVVEGHFGGATNVMSIDPAVASYLANITISGQIDGTTTTPVLAGNTTVPIRFLNLTNCNIGGNVNVAAGFSNFVQNSVINDQQTGQWLAGNRIAYTSGTQALPLFSVDSDVYQGTEISLSVNGVVGGVGGFTVAQHFLLKREGSVPELYTLDNDGVGLFASGGTLVKISTVATGTKVSFYAEFTATGAGTIEAQIKAIGGTIKVTRLSGTAPGGRTFVPIVWRKITQAQFGVKADGTTDDTTAAQNYASWVGAAGGGEVVLSGSIKLTAALTLSNPNVKVRGNGRKATKLLQYTASAATLAITGQYCAVEDLSIEYNSQGTAGGTAIDCTGAFYSQLSRLNIYKPDIGVKYGSACNSNFGHLVKVEDATTNGVLVTGSSNINWSQFQILNSNTTLCATGCIRIYGQSEGNDFSHGQTYQGAYSLTTDASAYTFGARPAYNKFTSLFLDGSANGTQIDKATETDLIDCWYSARPANGLYLIQVDGVRVTGGNAINCGMNGILLDAQAKRVTINGVAARSNSVSSSGTYSGIAVSANTTDFSITNCQATNTALTFGTQKYGIEVKTGTSDRYVVWGNSVQGNGTAGVIDGGSGANKTIAANY